MRWPFSSAPRELEFLPAALEVQESPPSPLGRAVAWAVIGVFAAAVVWAALGTVDVVAVARGRLIPSDYSKVVQPLESGIVRAIHVRDGQEVRAGAVLIELDPTTSRAEHERLTRELAAVRVHIARLRALLDGRRTLEAAPGADPTFVALQQQMLRDQWKERESRIEAARFLVEQRRAAIAATRADIERLETTVPMLAERARAFRILHEGGFVARMQYLEVEEQRVTRVQALAMQRERLAQDRAALAEAEKQLDALESEFTRSRLGELAEWETRAASLAQEVVKAARKSSIQRLTAPVDGVVQQLVIHTVGAVVTPAQPLMVIVPRDHPLEVEAWVENKDVGFVGPGQPVEVKIDAFPFTRYGAIRGRMTVVSRDAVQQEKGVLLYAARARLERSSVQVDGRPVPLLAGMAVSAEVKTGERRLIEFFLSPLLRSAAESLRER
jgi:hemolysin D